MCYAVVAPVLVGRKLSACCSGKVRDVYGQDEAECGKVDAGRKTIGLLL